MKKSPKSQKFRRFKVCEVRNIELMVQPFANRYYIANYTCITIVHHVTGKKIQLFLTFRTFFHRKDSFSTLWRPEKMGKPRM